MSFPRILIIRLSYYTTNITFHRSTVSNFQHQKFHGVHIKHNPQSYNLFSPAPPNRVAKSRNAEAIGREKTSAEDRVEVCVKSRFNKSRLTWVKVNRRVLHGLGVFQEKDW